MTSASPSHRLSAARQAGVPDVSDFGLADLAGPAEVEPGARLPSDARPVPAPLRAPVRSAARLPPRLAWEYEPRGFAIAWDDDGTVTRMFRPDFYLPAFDTYIEITTSSQRLVTRKNRKLRLLREHHPEIRCKLFYQRDYLELAHRFGLDVGGSDEEE